MGSWRGNDANNPVDARGELVLLEDPRHLEALDRRIGRLTARSSGCAAKYLPLSALRMLFSWLVVHQVVRENPTASVRGLKLVVAEGKTPYLPAEDVVRLIESIPTDTLVGLRDRALIGVMAYTFARVGAAVGMNVDDYYPEGKQWALRFRKKGGKRKQIAAHHRLEEYMDAYLTAAGLASILCMR